MNKLYIYKLHFRIFIIISKLKKLEKLEKLYWELYICFIDSWIIIKYISKNNAYRKRSINDL